MLKGLDNVRRAGLAASIAAMSVAAPASAAEMINFTTVSNTDVATFGIGRMRNNGTGSLAVSGLSGTVTRAYLFWHGPTNSSDPLANASVAFGGTNILGVNIGFSADNAWNFQNSQAYRADVTSLVSGNGSYALSNFLGTDANVNGASLVVFYDDGNAANNSDVVLFNGNDSNLNNPFDANNWNAALNGINYSGGPASLTLHVSDGQTFPDAALLLNGTQLAAAGPLFQGNNVQLGNGNFPGNGALWDIETFNITSFLNPGINNLSLTSGTNSDALGLIVAQFNLPVGAAPPTQNAVPEPATWLMMMLGFAFIGGSLRSKQLRRKVSVSYG